MFPFFSINIKKPAASVSGLSVCDCEHVSAWSSFIITCTSVFCSSVLTPLLGSVFLFCVHPAQLPMANFTSVLNCKMSLDIQMPRVLSSWKNCFPLQWSEEMLCSSAVYVVAAEQKAVIIFWLPVTFWWSIEPCNFHHSALHFIQMKIHLMFWNPN